MPKPTKIQINARLKAQWNSLMKTLFPEGYTCLFCGSELNEEDRVTSLCPKCRKSLPVRRANVCPICGEYTGINGICPKCIKSIPPFSASYAPFDYTGIIRSIINNYKDGANPWMDKYLAKYLLDFFKSKNITADYIAFVPSSAKMVKRRGFDHTKRIVKLLMIGSGIPMLDALSCIESRHDQSSLDTLQRESNATKSFKIKEDFDRSVILGKRVILFDDIMTTGATVTTCANILKNNGAREIIILTIARS